MASKEIEILIVKYLIKEATSTDLDTLSEWIKEPENEKIFDRYVKIHYEITITMNDPDIEAIKKNLLRKINKEKYPFNKIGYSKVLKYAALFILLITSGYFFNKSNSEPGHIEINNSLLIPKEEAITLQLENGTVQQINLGESKKILDSQGNVIGNQKGQNINYSESSNKEVLVYNVLTIPKGKKFEVTLSDGTHIFLNSASSMRYPVKFPDGSPREVFITGEAYFDVAKDTQRPFIVHSNEMEISVLGTKFNVSNYPENESISTVLVEGSVKLGQHGGQNNTMLKPGYKAKWNRMERDVVGIENVDTRIYTAWIEGKLIFRNATFKHIRHTLERHYNVTIINNNENLDEQRFDATFDIETINEVLEAFNISYAIEFSIQDNKAIIN